MEEKKLTQEDRKINALTDKMAAQIIGAITAKMKEMNLTSYSLSRKINVNDSMVIRALQPGNMELRSLARLILGLGGTADITVVIK